MTGSPRSLLVGTAGHIDHGKTVLVKALTGVDTDRLPEEKRRGITIDLGFASTEVLAEDGAPISLSFIDVPGHRLFVRNMLAGAGGIDCVMLVISATEGVMPQTEEHLAICGLLGIRRGLVVLTKADLVSEERLAQTCAEVGRFAASSFLRDAPLLRVSALTGAGLPELRHELVLLSARKTARDDAGQLRLPVDRAFMMRGFGTVVTGTLQAGSLVRGEALSIEPGGISVRARGLQIHGQSQERAVAGSRVAVNLSGIEVADVHRGATLVRPSSDQPSSVMAVETIDVEVTLLDGAPELRPHASTRFHCFAAESVAALSLYSSSPLQAGESAMARIRLARPMLLLPGDRFVLRRLSPAQTIGGGRVLDAHPVARIRKKEVLAWLEKIKDAPAKSQVLPRVARRGSSGLGLSQLARELGWTVDAASEAARPLLGVGDLVRVGGDLLLAGEAFTAAQVLVLSQLTRLAGKAGTAFAGVKRSELRSHTGLSPEVFEAAIVQLAAERKLRSAAETVNLYAAPGQLPAADQARMASIAAAYRGAGLNAPLFADVVRKTGLKQAEMQRLMTLLLRSKTLVKLGVGDLFVHQDALAELQQKVRALRGQPLDVSRFKQLTGLSRKYAIPLLEYLDREHVTRKQGDSRVVL